MLQLPHPSEDTNIHLFLKLDSEMLCIRKLRTPVKAYLVNMKDVAATLSTATPQGEFFCLSPPVQLQMQLRYEYMNIWILPPALPLLQKPIQAQSILLLWHYLNEKSIYLQEHHQNIIHFASEKQSSRNRATVLGVLLPVIVLPTTSSTTSN